MGNDAQVLRKIRIGQLQGGAFTAGGLEVRIGDGKTERNARQQRRVRRVVADAGAGRGRNAELRGQSFEAGELVADALEHVPDAEFAAAPLHGG